MLTIKDIAKHAGVSQATVSRVINNTKPVKEETRNRVQMVIDKYHYQPNVHASSLGKNNSAPIGIAYFSGLEESFAMLSDIEQLAKTYNIPTQIRSADMNAKSELDTITSLLSFGCKIIIVHTLYTSDATLAKLAGLYPQLYFIDRKVQGFEQRCIWFEHEEAGKLIANTALRKKPSKCWCIFRQDLDQNTLRRERGIMSILHQRLSFEVIRSHVSALDGEAVIRDLISRGEDPKNIIVDADLTALGTVAAYAECLPQQSDNLSIVSFGGSHLFNLYRPKITQIQYPLSKMAKKLFIQAISDQVSHDNKGVGACLYPTLSSRYRVELNTINGNQLAL